MPERPNPEDVDQNRSAGGEPARPDAEITRDTPLRDRVSPNAEFGPGFVDDMADTGRFFSWPTTPPKAPLEGPPSDALTYGVTMQETHPLPDAWQEPR